MESKCAQALLDDDLVAWSQDGESILRHIIDANIAEHPDSSTPDRLVRLRGRNMPARIDLPKHCSTDSTKKMPCWAISVYKEITSYLDGRPSVVTARLEHFHKLADRQERQEARDNEASEIGARICDWREEIRVAQESIVREREIGRTVGVVDRSILHADGSHIVDARIEMRKAEAEFQQLMGLPFSKSKWTCTVHKDDE